MPPGDEGVRDDVTALAPAAPTVTKYASGQTGADTTAAKFASVSAASVAGVWYRGLPWLSVVVWMSWRVFSLLYLIYKYYKF